LVLLLKTNQVGSRRDFIPGHNRGIPIAEIPKPLDNISAAAVPNSKSTNPKRLHC
jgi:hypothetical protein